MNEQGEDPRWFDVQYEWHPFYCFACGIMGHSEIECPNPVPQNEFGKLPYDIQLRAPEDRRKSPQSFADAAIESWGSGSSSGFKPPRAGRTGSERSARGDGGSCYSSSSLVNDGDNPEVQSPLKAPDGPTVTGKKPAGVLWGENCRCLMRRTYGYQPRKGSRSR